MHCADARILMHLATHNGDFKFSKDCQYQTVVALVEDQLMQCSSWAASSLDAVLDGNSEWLLPWVSRWSDATNGELGQWRDDNLREH